MNIKDSYLHGGTHVVKNINFLIAASGTNQNKLVATITWAEEGSSNTELAIPISGATFGSLTKNTVFAAPNGSNGVPSFRTLVAADIPNISANKITSDTLGADRLPLATNSAKGAVILGVAKTSDADSAITGKKYWVKMNANGKLFIDVPWTDHTYTVNNATFSIKSKIGTNDAVTLSDFTANLSAADDFTLIQGSNITFTNDATNRTLIIAGTPNTTYKLTLNGTVKGTTGGTDLGTFYAIATSDTSTANQVWMRNSSNDGYGWRTLGSRAFDSTAYLPLTGGTISHDDFGPFFIQRNHTTNAAAIGFKHYSSGTTVEVMGYIGMNAKDGALKRWNAASSTEYIILDSENSSVSKSGETLTVKINGTSQSLTNTWRGIQDNLTSSSATTLSLSAKQGYLLANGSARDNTKLPLSGANYNTATDTNPFTISRTGGTVEAMLIMVNDARTLFKYTNDESASSIVFQLVNTNTESGNETAASDRNVTISSNTTGIFLSVGGTLVSLNGHKHAYTDLTGSSTTANQAIVSSGTANGWTLKTLGSRAFDSTAYVPIAGGTMTGILTVPKIRINGKHSSGNTSKGIYYYDGTTDYLIAGYGSSNLWIGANETAGTHHTGSTYISAGSGDVYISKLVNGTRNNYIVYHAANIPSNSASAKGVVPAGVASSVYMTDASKNPSWTSIDNTVTSGSSHLVTSGAVYTAIANNVASAVQYQGTIASEADMIALTSAGQGDFARVTTEFTFTDASGASVTAHVGDVVYLTNNTPGTASNWIVAHTEIDTNTWTAASTSAAGYVPKLATGGANLAAASTDYVLAFTNGATSPSWLKLPANAYKDTWIAWTGATDSAAGTAGYMPGASVANRTKFLRGDGSWIALSLTDHTHSVKINGSTKTIAAPGGTAVDLGNYIAYSVANITTIDDTNNPPSVFTLQNNELISGFGYYYYIFNMGNNNNGNHAVQLAARYQNSAAINNNIPDLFIRKANQTVWTSWYRFAHDGNISNKAAVIGTTATTLATIAGVNITASLPKAARGESAVTSGVITPTSSGTTKFLREDGTWQTPSYTTNTDRTGIKLATVSGTKKTDGTVIITNSSTGLSIAGGTNKFSIGDGTNYIEVAVTPSITNNVTGSGTSGKLVKWSGTNTITDGPALSSAISSLSLTTKFLREDGTWAAPSYTTDTVRPIYSGGTSRFTNSLKTAINFVGAGATSVTYEAAGTGSGQSGNANYANIKISSNNDLVKFSAITANTEYYLPVRAKNTTDTAQLLYRTSIIVKDSTITATLSGNASTATNLNKASGTNRGYLYLSANTTTACTGVGSVTAVADIGIPYIGYASNANTYGIYKDLFYLSGSTKYIGNDIHSNKFACVKTKDSVTDDWTGSSTSGQQSGSGTTYSAGDGISISNGVISSTRKEWYGTEAQFNSLSSLNNNTTYYIMV